MAISEARKRANQKYDAKAYFRTTVRIKREYEQELKELSGDSINKFIVQAVMEKIEREKNK